jgi:hypothetical protein
MGQFLNFIPRHFEAFEFCAVLQDYDSLETRNKIIVDVQFGEILELGQRLQVDVLESINEPMYAY